MPKTAPNSPSADPDDAPEWTDEMRADLMLGDTVIRPPHRPRGSKKTLISLRTATLDAFRAQGPGWQSRINAALKKAAGV